MGSTTFFSAAVRRPSVMGAMAPTSTAMARMAALIVPRTRPATVVELGPGTGPVSHAIQDRLRPGSRHVAIEVDPGMVGHLRRVHPWLEVVEGDAGELDALLQTAGVTHADAVVSTLPWSLFDDAKQRRIVEQIHRTITPGGAFSAVIGLHALALNAGARRFHGTLRATFDEVILTRTVWANTPPSRAWICR